MFRFRSVSNIVIAPARTGRESSKRIVVIFTAQTNNGIRSNLMVGRNSFVVEMKLIEARIDLAPARWREKIAMSTEGPLWAMFLAKGGYTVHPVPAPFSTIADMIKRVSDGGISQNLRLFIRGNAISGAPNIKGINQLPNPPMRTGITRKKIIRKA